jgi:hypothetical protein
MNTEKVAMFIGKETMNKLTVQINEVDSTNQKNICRYKLHVYTGNLIHYKENA